MDQLRANAEDAMTAGRQALSLRFRAQPRMQTTRMQTAEPPHRYLPQTQDGQQGFIDAPLLLGADVPYEFA